jgi:excisionase family DNA binding protein
MTGPMSNSVKPSPDLGIRETATELRVSADTVRRYVASGRLSAYRLGPRLIRVRRESIDALLAGASR